MTDGMIRCVALLRAMGSDPLPPYLGPKPPENVPRPRGSLVPMLVLVASLATAFVVANAWALPGVADLAR